MLDVDGSTQPCNPSVRWVDSEHLCDIQNRTKDVEYVCHLLKDKLKLCPLWNVLHRLWNQLTTAAGELNCKATLKSPGGVWADVLWLFCMLLILIGMYNVAHMVCWTVQVPHTAAHVSQKSLGMQGAALSCCPPWPGPGHWGYTSSCCRGLSRTGAGASPPTAHRGHFTTSGYRS